MDWKSETFGLLFIFSGPCLLAFAAISVVRTEAFLRGSVEVSGEVIRLERSKDRGQYAYTYAPVFSFTTSDGETYTVISGISSSPPSFSVGEPVRVRYTPANPADARIHSFFQTWGKTVISGAIGVAFVVVGCDLVGLTHLVK